MQVSEYEIMHCLRKAHEKVARAGRTLWAFFESKHPKTTVLVSYIHFSNICHVCFQVQVAAPWSWPQYVQSHISWTETNLISIYKDNLIHCKREKHIQEKDLIAPDDALLLRLLVQPTRPLILHQFILETISISHVRNRFLQHTNIKRNVTKNCQHNTFYIEKHLFYTNHTWFKKGHI